MITTTEDYYDYYNSTEDYYDYYNYVDGGAWKQAYGATAIDLASPFYLFYNLIRSESMFSFFIISVYFYNFFVCTQK